MVRQPELTEQEWELILDLLQNERRDLPSEIHHTDTQRMHDELQQRLRMVIGLIERLQHTSPAAR